MIGYREYVDLNYPGNVPVFKQGEEITVYCEFNGARYRSVVGGAREQQVEAYLSVLDCNNKVVDAVHFLKPEDGKRVLEPDELFNTGSYLTGNYTLPSSLRPGDYILRIKMIDRVSVTRDTARISLSFRVGP